MGARNLARLRRLFALSLHELAAELLANSARVSIVKSGLFTSVPFLVGALLIVLTNWIGDAILTAETVRRETPNGGGDLPGLTAGGMAIPYVQSIRRSWWP